MRQYYEDDEPRRDRRDDPYESGRRGRREERGFMDRAADEVRSWFGNEDAERRRRMEDREGETWRGRQGDRGWDGDERAWARQWGYVEGRPRSDREWGERAWSPRSGGERGSSERSWGEQGSGDRGWAERGWGDRGWGERERAWNEAGYGSAPWYGGGYGGTSHGAPERFWSERGAEQGPWGRREMGWSRGRYTGRGPRNYQRSDERIKEDVCELLAQHGEIDATDVDVTVSSGVVTLGGRVDNRWEKRIAEDLAENVWGIKDVQNQIRVSPGETGPTGESGQPWRSRAA